MPNWRRGWQARIQALLDKGVVPLVDLESTLPYEDAKAFPKAALDAMDRLGVALISFDAYAAANTKKYQWSYYLEPLVNAHPDRFIPAANTGHNKSWMLQKPGKPNSFAQALKEHLRKGRATTRSWASSSSGTTCLSPSAIGQGQARRRHTGRRA